MTTTEKTPVEILQEWIGEGLFEPQPYNLRDTGAVKRAATLLDIAQGVLAMASSPRATLSYYKVDNVASLDIGNRYHPKPAEIILLAIQDNIFLEEFDDPAVGTDVFGYYADEMAVHGIILMKRRLYSGSWIVTVDVAIESHQHMKWSGNGDDYTEYYLGDGFGLVGTNSLGTLSNGFCIYESQRSRKISDLLAIACGEPVQNRPKLRVGRNEFQEVRWALWKKDEEYFTEHLPNLGPFLKHLATLPLMNEE